METYFNSQNEECVSVTYPDGSTWSGLKTAYDAMQAEQSTPMVTDEAATL
jgi:hypothetical protein